MYRLVSCFFDYEQDEAYAKQKLTNMKTPEPLATALHDNKFWTRSTHEMNIAHNMSSSFKKN